MSKKANKYGIWIIRKNKSEGWLRADASKKSSGRIVFATIREVKWAVFIVQKSFSLCGVDAVVEERPLNMLSTDAVVLAKEDE